MSSEVTDRMFELNTLGPIKLARAALSHMLRRKKGRMVVIASMAAKVPSPGQAIYSGKPTEVGQPHSGCPNRYKISTALPASTHDRLQDGPLRLFLHAGDRSLRPRRGRDPVLPGTRRERGRRTRGEVRLRSYRVDHAHRGAQRQGQGASEAVRAAGSQRGGSRC